MHVVLRKHFLENLEKMFLGYWQWLVCHEQYGRHTELIGNVPELKHFEPIKIFI